MLKIITTLSMVVIGLLAQAQSTEVREMENFSKIVAGKGVEIVFTESATPSIVVEASSSNAIRKVKTEFSNGILTATGSGTVYLAASGIKSIMATGNSKIKVSNQWTGNGISIALQKGSQFSGNVQSESAIDLSAGSGTIFNIRVESKTVTGDFSDGSKVNISGFAGSASLKTANRSLCNARNFITDQVKVNAEKGSNVLICAKGYVDLDMDETSKVTYYGSPERIRLPENSLSVSKANMMGRQLTSN